MKFEKVAEHVMTGIVVIVLVVSVTQCTVAREKQDHEYRMQKMEQNQ